MPEHEMIELRAEAERLRAEMKALQEKSATPSRHAGLAHVALAEGTVIHDSVSLLTGSSSREISIGRQVKIYRGTEILGPVSIGDGTFINRDVYIRPQVTIGKNVSIGPFARLVTDTHAIGGPGRRAGAVSWDPIAVGDGVWIGVGATILPGISIGNGAVVAAGAIVTHDVPENTLVGGVPARVLRHLDADVPRGS